METDDSLENVDAIAPLANVTQLDYDQKVEKKRTSTVIGEVLNAPKSITEDQRKSIEDNISDRSQSKKKKSNLYRPLVANQDKINKLFNQREAKSHFLNLIQKKKDDNKEDISDLLTKEVLRKETINAAVDFFLQSQGKKEDVLSEHELEKYCQTTVGKF